MSVPHQLLVFYVLRYCLRYAFNYALPSSRLALYYLFYLFLIFLMTFLSRPFQLLPVFFLCLSVNLLLFRLYIVIFLDHGLIDVKLTLFLILFETRFCTRIFHLSTQSYFFLYNSLFYFLVVCSCLIVFYS